MDDGQVSDVVVAQFDAVRRVGAVNMFDRSGVVTIAEACGFDELVAFAEGTGRRWGLALKVIGERLAEQRSGGQG